MIWEIASVFLFNWLIPCDLGDSQRLLFNWLIPCDLGDSQRLLFLRIKLFTNRHYMQEVTPSEVASAVRMLMAIWMMVFQVSFFMFSSFLVVCNFSGWQF